MRILQVMASRANGGAETYSAELRFQGIEGVGMGVIQLPTANALDVYNAMVQELERLIPPRRLSLEESLEFCREDECVEITATAVRLRKVILNAADRAKSRSRR